MRKHYAASMYSQKSTTSAKSGRSFLSLTTKPVYNEPESLKDAKQGLWTSLKSWMPPNPLRRRAPEGTTTNNKAPSIASSSSSVRSFSSYSRFKKRFLSGISNSSGHSSSSSSPQDDGDSHSSTKRMTTTTTQPEEPQSPDRKDSATSSSDEPNTPNDMMYSHPFSLPVATPAPPHTSKRTPSGILLNAGGDSEEAVAEQRLRRQARRQYLMQTAQRRRQQQQHHQRQQKEQQQLHFQPQQYYEESSSSSTLLSTPPPPDEKHTFHDDGENDLFIGPRVTFLETSPVPRFRNAPPAPPASPPYLHVSVADDPYESVIQAEDEPDELGGPTVFTTKRRPNSSTATLSTLASAASVNLCPRLYFHAPLSRGQTLAFCIHNALPEEHILVYKFLTSNAKLGRRRKRRSDHTTRRSAHVSVQQPIQSGERYFVRPSAGRMVAADHTEIMLFLNHVPTMHPDEVLKDKILVRWAVVQRHTQVDAWVQSLTENTRRKWLEMLVERWPDQVTVRETRLKIRFV